MNLRVTMSKNLEELADLMIVPSGHPKTGDMTADLQVWLIQWDAKTVAMFDHRRSAGALALVRAALEAFDQAQAGGGWEPRWAI